MFKYFSIFSFKGVHRMGLVPREEEDIISAIGTILATISSGEVLDISLKRVLKPCYEAIEILVSPPFVLWNTIAKYYLSH